MFTRNSSLPITLHILLCGLTSIFLIGCVASPEKAAQSESSMTFDKQGWEKLAMQRADERWRLVSEKKFDEAFAMYTEASRINVNAAWLAAGIRNMRALGGKSEKAECTPEKCIVSVNVTISFRIPRVGNKQQIVPFNEIWMPEKGALYLIREQ
jgi:hypothetical protein